MADLVTERLSLLLKDGTVTLGFVLDVAVAGAQGHLNIFSVLDEVAALEGTGRGPSRTKPPTEFRGPLLRGLWHKHYFQGRFLAKNLLVEFGKGAIVHSVLRPHAGEDWTEEVVNRLVHEV